jgi:O-6-methylguanine DNA methyltransferase
MDKRYYDTLLWNNHPVTLVMSVKGLEALEFGTIDKVLRGSAGSQLRAVPKHDPLALRPYMIQLTEYFDGTRQIFDIPLQLTGTDFQQRVWSVLLTIPYGKVMSYQEVAEDAGNKKAVRAAGMANNRNPVSIIVPCHRVVGKSGSLTGYGGGLDLKEMLLNHEGISVTTGRITEKNAWMKQR